MLLFIILFLFISLTIIGQDLSGVFAAVSQNFIEWALCEEQPAKFIIGQILDLKMAIILPDGRTIMRQISTLTMSPGNVAMPKKIPILAKGIYCKINLIEHHANYFKVSSCIISGNIDNNLNLTLKKIIAYLLWDENFLKIDSTRKIKLMEGFRFSATNFIDKITKTGKNLIFNIQKVNIARKENNIHLNLEINLWDVNYTNQATKQEILICEYTNLSATLVFSGLGTKTITLQKVISEDWKLPEEYKEKFQSLAKNYGEKFDSLQLSAPGQKWIDTKTFYINLDPSEKYIVFYEPTQFTMAEIASALQEQKEQIGLLIFFQSKIFPEIIYHFQPQMTGSFFPIFVPIREQDILEVKENFLEINSPLKLGKNQEQSSWSVSCKDAQEKIHAKKFLCSSGIKINFESPNIFILQGESLLFLDGRPFIKLQNMEVRYKFYYQNSILNLKAEENGNSPRFKFYNKDDDNEANQIRIQTVWQAALNISNWLLEKKSKKLFSDVDELLIRVRNQQEIFTPQIKSLELKTQNTSGIVIYSNLKSKGSK